jgi:hypothetical protein
MKLENEGRGMLLAELVSDYYRAWALSLLEEMKISSMLIARIECALRIRSFARADHGVKLPQNS